jgi:hypothetical protein
MWLRDYPSARRELGRALTIDRGGRSLSVGDTIWLSIASGDTTTARAVMAPLRPQALDWAVVWLIRDLGVGWVLGPDHRRMAITVMQKSDQPSEQVMLAIALDAWLGGRLAAARAAADSATALLIARLAVLPREPALWAKYAQATALSSHPERVKARVDSARAFADVTVDHFEGAYWGIWLAEAAAMAGENEQALALIRRLLDAPGPLTPAWLRVDPWFAPLHQDPEFRKLARL